MDYASKLKFYKDFPIEGVNFVDIIPLMQDKETFSSLIADRHNISINTVITHRKNITRKTGIKTVAGLTVYAILNGYVDINSVK